MWFVISLEDMRQPLKQPVSETTNFCPARARLSVSERISRRDKIGGVFSRSGPYFQS